MAPGTVVVLDDRYGVARLTTASGIRLLTYGDPVLVDEGYDGGGDPGVVYRYLGPNGRLDLGGQDYSDDALWAPVGGDAGQRLRATSAPAGDRSTSTRRTTRTRRSGRPLGGKVGQRLRVHGRRTARSNLAHQDYTDLGYWKPVSETQLFPQGFNITQSPSAAIGGLVVLNDVRSDVARVHRSTRPSRAASAAISGDRAGGHPRERRQHRLVVGRQLVHRAGHVARAQRRDHDEPHPEQRERVRRGQRRHGRPATSRSARSNLSQIDAITESASSSGANSMSFQLAFNTIGWLPTNLLLRRARRAHRRPADPERRVRRPAARRDDRARQATRDVDAGGAISLSALSAMIIVRARRQLRDLGARPRFRRRRHERQRRPREQHGRQPGPRLRRGRLAHARQRRAARTAPTGR